MEKGKKSYHLLDRYLGIPLTFFLGLIRNRWKKKPAAIKRIAIVNLFSIGDNVLMSAAIAATDSRMARIPVNQTFMLTSLSLLKISSSIVR